jgi:hypothetical protein
MRTQTVMLAFVLLPVGCSFGPIGQLGERPPAKPPQVSYSGQPAPKPYELGDPTRDPSYYDEADGSGSKYEDTEDSAVCQPCTDPACAKPPASWSKDACEGGSPKQTR